MPRYNSKLLLFGEYLIIRSGRALAVPYENYGGQWEFTSDDLSSQQDLKGWADYLVDLMKKGQLLCSLNLSKFCRDLEEGMFFDADIPVGYGLGSSGALCAALYEVYGRNKIGKNEIDRFSELRKVLAQLENFFHGSSSGIDPLISYTGNAVKIREDGSMEICNLPSLLEGASFFLIDTQKPRQTGPLVQYFLEQCKDEAYAKQIDGPLTEASGNAIQHYLQNNLYGLNESMKQISRFQFELFPKMIPENFRPLWQKGLESGAFSLKLCGAGGGGFILGFTHDKKLLGQELGEVDWKLLKL
ncbi:MAG: mevalonate kinase [Bacteroidetes bacterium]|nr:MAG: mevalonate kinase [Bacteroidota bacterium]